MLIINVVKNRCCGDRCSDGFKTILQKVKFEIKKNIIEKYTCPFLKFLYILKVVSPLFLFPYTTYQFFHTGGHQQMLSINSVLSLNVTGVLTTEGLDPTVKSHISSPYIRVWDSYDLVIPTQSEGFFVTTNIALRNQSLGSCRDSIYSKGSRCTKNTESTDCTKGKQTTNGFTTGRCIYIDSLFSTCEIRGWCPAHRPEFPHGNPYIFFPQTENFTLSLNNIVTFSDISEFGRLLDTQTDCLNNGTGDPKCPHFLIGDIVRRTGFSFEDVALSGGVVWMTINWDCDFDGGRTIDDCVPDFKYKRVDVMDAKDKSTMVEFRNINFIGTNNRTLADTVGIKFYIQVTGEGRKFMWIPFLVGSGALIAIFSAYDRMWSAIVKIGKVFHFIFPQSKSEEKIPLLEGKEKRPSLELEALRKEYQLQQSTIDSLSRIINREILRIKNPTIQMTEDDFNCRSSE